ncbi:MAG: toprim domain-containing protein [Lawsonibacter sp.]
MSFCTLHRQMRSNAVALCGLYRGPLDNYLRENPHLKQIVLCLDADGPGQEADGEVPGRVHPGGLCRVHSNSRPGQGLERVPASAEQRGEEAEKRRKMTHDPG